MHSEGGKYKEEENRETERNGEKRRERERVNDSHAVIDTEEPTVGLNQNI